MSTDAGGLSRRNLLAVIGAAASGGCVYFRWGAEHSTYAASAAAIEGNVLRIPRTEIEDRLTENIVVVQLGEGYEDVVIARSRWGGWVAATAECSHWGCTIGWNNDAAEWACPCHGSRFAAADGKVLEGPAEEPLTAVPIREEGKDLAIEVIRSRSRA